MRTYTDRDIYRGAVEPDDLTVFRVEIRETDLLIAACADFKREATESVLRHRLALESYLGQHPEFGESLLPVGAAPGAPPAAARMAAASAAAGVGPMAAVAGALADLVGEDLLRLSPTVIVENGGDVFLRSPRERVVGIFAGRERHGFSLGLRLPGGEARGVCTSSGVIGPSLSAGLARAATVLAPSAALADAAATALGNRIRSAGDLGAALEWVSGLEGVRGAVAMVGGCLAAWGEAELVELAPAARRGRT